MLSLRTSSSVVMVLLMIKIRIRIIIVIVVVILLVVIPADSTHWTSQGFPHPSTNQAMRRLTSEVGRDPVQSTRYGRQRSTSFLRVHSIRRQINFAEDSPRRSPRKAWTTNKGVRHSRVAFWPPPSGRESASRPELIATVSHDLSASEVKRRGYARLPAPPSFPLSFHLRN